MISKYLKSKNIISQIRPTINEEELLNDNSSNYFYLKTFDNTSQYYFYRNLFTSYELQKILLICKKIPSTEGVILGDRNSDDSYRKSHVSWIPVNNETLWFYEKLTHCINQVNESFFEYDLTRLEKLQFTHYYGNQKGFYSPHLDIMNGYLPDNRKLTFVLQLSDVDDYEGGELRLHLSKDPVSIPKERGLITFFPSHILHECTPVTSGKRYTLVGWIHGPKLR